MLESDLSNGEQDAHLLILDIDSGFVIVDVVWTGDSSLAERDEMLLAVGMRPLSWSRRFFV